MALIPHSAATACGGAELKGVTSIPPLYGTGSRADEWMQYPAYIYPSYHPIDVCRILHPCCRFRSFLMTFMQEWSSTTADTGHAADACHQLADKAAVAEDYHLWMWQRMTLA